MTAAAILAMPKPAAAPPGGLSAAAPGADGEPAFADMIESANGSATQGDRPATPAKDQVSTAREPVRTQPPQLVLSLPTPAETEATKADLVAGTGVKPDLVLPAEDLGDAQADDDVSPALDEAVLDMGSAEQAATAAAPLLLFATPAHRLALELTEGTSLAAAASGSPAEFPEPSAPEPESDAANTQIDAESAARQNAAAQLLAAMPPAVRGQSRLAETIPVKDAPSNASTARDAEPATGEAEPQARTAPAAIDAATSEPVTPPKATPDLKPEIRAAAVQADVETAPAQPVSTGPTPAAAPAQTAAVFLTQASHLAQATVETTVQISAQITRKLEGRSTRFEMGLTPEGLGRVDISLDIDSGGKLTARLAFDNPLAATEMRGKADELRRELQDAGFTIANDGLEFSERQSSSHDGFDRRQGRAFAGASRLNAEADLTQPAPAWVSLSLTPRGVDMKV